MLRYFGSYQSYNEIALILGVPVGTVKSRLNQVKVKLADALLQTAQIEHAEMRAVTSYYTSQFAQVASMLNRGELDREFLKTVAEDVTGIFGMVTFQGREFYVGGSCLYGCFR